MNNKDIVQSILERIKDAKDFHSFISTNKRIYAISKLLCRYRLEFYQMLPYPFEYDETLLEMHNYYSLKELRKSIGSFSFKYKWDDYTYYKISKIFTPQNRVLMSNNNYILSNNRTKEFFRELTNIF